MNVLGAGDMFAACFINNILQKNDIHESILNSHKQTTELLKENIL
jgi:pyridoxal/pyridoxine/pyridoxamine kinase